MQVVPTSSCISLCPDLFIVCTHFCGFKLCLTPILLGQLPFWGPNIRTGISYYLRGLAVWPALQKVLLWDHSTITLAFQYWSGIPAIWLVTGLLFADDLRHVFVASIFYNIRIVTGPRRFLNR